MIVMPPTVAAVLLADYALTTSFDTTLLGIIPGDENTSLSPDDGPRRIWPLTFPFATTP